MGCHQGLVGCAYAFSSQQTPLGKGIRRLHASHNLDHYFYFGIIYNGLEIVNQNGFYRVAREITQVQYIFDANLFAYSLINRCLIGAQDLYHA